MAEPVLAARDLAKHFGGLVAVSGVTLDVGLGEIHAVIGPNGAGKSTLINLLSGDLAPSGGSIRYAGAEIAGLAADRIARLGVARSYQKTNIFAGFTAFENCRLAAQSRLSSSMRFVAPALAPRRSRRGGGARPSDRRARRARRPRRRRAQPWRAAPARDRHDAGNTAKRASA